jgi:hypothetical protein
MIAMLLFVLAQHPNIPALPVQSPPVVQDGPGAPFVEPPKTKSAPPPKAMTSPAPNVETTPPPKSAPGAADRKPAKQPSQADIKEQEALRVELEKHWMAAQGLKQKKGPLAEPTLDAIIAARVANDADVRIAEAEVMLAVAKLNAVKVAAGRKVAGIQDAIREARTAVELEKAKAVMVAKMLQAREKELALAEQANSGQQEIYAAKYKLAEAEQQAAVSRVQQQSAVDALAALELHWKRTAESAFPGAADRAKVEAVVAAKAAEDPDVKIAEAEANLAYAKLNAVKVTTAQRVTVMHAALEAARDRVQAVRTKIDETEKTLAEVAEKLTRLDTTGQGKSVERELQRQRQEALSETFAKLLQETDLAADDLRKQEQAWKMFADQIGRQVVTPTPMDSTGKLTSMLGIANDVRWTSSTLMSGPATALPVAASRTPLAAGGSPTALLRAALDKVIKLDTDLEGNVDVVTEKLLAAAKLQIRVKYPGYIDPKLHKQPPPNMKLAKGEMSLGAWLVLVMDEHTDSVNSFVGGFHDNRTVQVEFFVRDYGLQLAPQGAVAAGAIKLSEFWKQPLVASPNAGPQVVPVEKSPTAPAKP